MAEKIEEYLEKYFKIEEQQDKKGESVPYVRKSNTSYKSLDEDHDFIIKKEPG